MRNYSIMVENDEERKKALRFLTECDVTELSDSLGISIYAYVRFKCSKKEWKKIKKGLNLRINTVYSNFKEG